MERSADKAKLAKCDDLEVTLDDEQSDELSSIMSNIEETSADELDKIFKEADGCSAGDSIRAVWELDRNNFKGGFLKNSTPTVSMLVGICEMTVMLLHASGNGCHTNYWSLVTIRIGMIIYAQFIAIIINL